MDFRRREPEFPHNERITDQVVQGKKVWHKYNCNDCHTILGFGGYYAPDMTKAYCRLGERNITHVVINPEKVYKYSFRKMPKLGVTPEEAKDLVAFLKLTADLARSSTFDRETMIRYMLDPAAVSPGSGMSPQQLSREKAELIADFVLGLR